MGGKQRHVAAPPSVAAIKGDTVYDIAKRYNVSVRALIDFNALKPPYQLYAGQTVYLPQVAEHIVAEGDTLSEIARSYRTSTRELARANNLNEPYTIRPGQRLRLPGVLAADAPPSPVAVPQAKPARPQESPRVQEAAVTQPAPAAAVPGPVAAPPPELPPVEGSPGGFDWPAQGELLARFGPVAKGQHNDGINIALMAGASIRAAADGVVAYAGNELRGFGNLLLIKHADGWMTAYAHNQELMVARGAKVKRGQVIAKAGATGGVRSPQLHFELRKGAQAVDPLRHLPTLRAGVETKLF